MILMLLAAKRCMHIWCPTYILLLDLMWIKWQNLALSSRTAIYLFAKSHMLGSFLICKYLIFMKLDVVLGMVSCFQFYELFGGSSAWGRFTKNMSVLLKCLLLLFTIQWSIQVITLYMLQQFYCRGNCKSMTWLDYHSVHEKNTWFF